jgi:uncharacterized protein
MTNTIWLAIGLVLVFEGLTYALVPGQMQKMMAQMQDMSMEHLRIGGTVALALGVFVIWMSSGTVSA